LRDGRDKTALLLAEEASTSQPEDEDRREVLRLVHLAHKRDAEMERRRLRRGAAAAAAVPPREMTVMSTLKDSVDALKGELSSSQQKTLEEIHELKTALDGHKVVLECLESAVTASAELMRQLKERLEGNSGAAGVPSPALPPNSGRDVVDAMMAKTSILRCSEEKVSRARGLFEKFNARSAFTRCLTEFWISHGGNEVRIDFDLHVIGRMKRKVLDHDGVVRNGNDYYSFADFSNGVVYVTGMYPEDSTHGLLADALAQMCFLLAFGNGGRPYERGDRESVRALRAAIREAEGKRGRSDRLDEYITYALQKTTSSAREIHITSTVPRIIAEHGPGEGTLLLRTHYPLLLDFYECHVLGALR
jgi:hypothetical protein